MNRFIKYCALFFFSIISVSTFAQNISNKGKEFWVAYGHHEYFESDNSQNMTLYLSVDDLPAGVQYATVTVTIDSSKPVNSLWWTRTYHIPKNTVVSIDKNDPNIFSYSPLGANGALPWGPIPKGNTNNAQAAHPTSVNYDARLYGIPPPVGNGGDGLFTGKGIHITSDYDMVVYAHIYSAASSGATMLLPTNSWGYNYTAINNSQVGYEAYDFNYFFIIASEDSTSVKITPTANSRTGKVAGTPFTVNMNKGNVYQYVGFTNQTANASGDFVGLQLTNSKIESVPNATGRCKKIAVFCGSSRTQGEIDCGGGGRDNELQQCFPEHTWGRRYATVPFSSSSGTITPSAFMTTIYKVVAKEAGTTITINGGAPIALPVGSIYKFSNNIPNLIVGNNPIMVAQFMGGGCGAGLGDPEMVYLSPVEQAIPKIGMYRNIFDHIDINYMSLVIPDSGIATLKIDGQGVLSNFGGNSYTTNHPNLPGYKIVVKGWVGYPNGYGQTLVSSNARFNTIVYGLGSAESYAYVGGAYLNNISATAANYNVSDTLKNIDSINVTNQGIIFNNDTVNVRANIAFQPRKIEWLFNEIDTTIANVVRVCDGVKNTDVVDTTSGGYTYVSPFNFTGYDTFYIKGCDATGSNCVQQMHVVKVGTPFTANTNTIYLTTAFNTNKASSALTEAAPSGGTTPYTYANVNSAGVVGIRSAKQCRVLVVGTNYNYIPTPGFAGVDTFYIRVCDASTPSNCFTQMHIITVGAAFSGDINIMRNATATNTNLSGSAVAEINAVGGVTPYSYQIVNSSRIVTSTSNNGAAVTINATSGAYTYTPVAGFTGTDTFYVKLCDASVVSNCLIQMHVVTVGTSFSASSAAVNHTTTLNKSFITNATDDINLAGGVGPYDIQVVNNTNIITTTSIKGASITINNVNGKVTYTPLAGFVGIDTFYIKVCDASATPNCATQMHIVTVTNNFIINGADIVKNTVTNNPINGNSKSEINATGGVKNYRYRNVNVLGLFSDTTTAKGLVQTDSVTGLYTYTPKLDFYGIDTFYIRVCDSSAVKNCLTQRYIVNVVNGKTYSIGVNKQIDGNALVDNKAQLSNNRPYTFNSYNSAGLITRNTSTKGGIVSVGPGYIGKIVKGQDTQYVFAAPTCNYVFNKKDTSAYKYDSVYIPIVIYTKAINGVPAGCYGAGGLVGDTVRLLYVIAPKPRCIMNVSRNSSCPTDLNVNFFGYDSASNFTKSQLPAIRWSWKITGTYLGAPVSYNDQTKNATHLFDTGTVVTATLITTYKSGATSTQTINFPFSPSSVQFTVEPKICIGQSITTIDISVATAGKDSCTWDFGDGSLPVLDRTCSQQIHQYLTAGSYNITHSITLGGCTAKIPPVTHTVVVSDRRYPAIAYPTNCLDTIGTANFWRDSSIAAGGVGTSIDIYKWHFGDIASGSLDSSALNPASHIYPKEDNYTVTLHVEDKLGCKGDTTALVTIKISPNIYFKPLPANICINTNVTSLDFSSYAGCYNQARTKGYGIFKGNGIDTLGNFSPKIAGSGTQTIWYVYKSSNGCSDSISRQITVHDSAKVAFDYNPKAVCLPKDGNVSFTNLTTGDIGTFLWHFDDASYATVANPDTTDLIDATHKFTDKGIHNIKLLSTSPYGCRDSLIVPITFSVTPDVKFSPITSACENETNKNVAFASVVNNVLGAGSYFGTGTTAAGILSPAISSWGTHNITYIFTSTGGCIDSASQSILVKARPRLSFTYPAGCLPSNGLVQFTDNTTLPDGQTVQSCIWTFGDANASAGNPNSANICSPSHIYNYGTDTIYHSVTSSLGCVTDTTFKATFNIKPQLFYKTIAPVCENITSYNVDSAGSNNLTLAPGAGVYHGVGITNPTTGDFNPFLAGAGIQTIWYVFTATSGCIDSISQTVFVKARPKGQFTFSPNGCLNPSGTVQFDASGITVAGSTITNYNWKFEGINSNIVNGISPSHSYNDGIDTISLNIQAANGCSFDTSQIVTFSKKPALTVLPIIVKCENDAAFDITPKPTPTNGAIGSGYFKSYKNAITDTIKGTYNPSIAGFGIDTIYFIFTTNPGGCDTIIKTTITINAKPIPSFIINPSNNCLDVNGKVDFDASATKMNDNSAIQKYEWLFENGTMSGTGITSTHNYNDGVYDIKLTVTGVNTCVDTLIINKTFSKKPALTVLPIIVKCENDAAFDITPKPTPTNGAIGSGYFKSYKNAITDTIKGTYNPSIAGFGIDTIYFIFTTNPGGCDTIIKTIITINAKPIPSFIINPNNNCLDVNGKVDFDASATKMNDNSAIQKYEWLFENGTMLGTGITSTHNYNDGTFNIKLTVTGTNGCVDTTSQTKAFSKRPALTVLPIIDTCENVAPFTIAQPTPTNGAIGSGVFSSFKNAITSGGLYTPSIAGYGIDTIYFRFTTNPGNCDTIIKKAITIRAKPIPAFTINPPNNCLDVNGKVDFDASATKMNDNSTIQKFDWLFESGTISDTGVAPTHNYNDGSFNITLTVTGTNGCVDTTSQTKTFSKKPAVTPLANYVKCENDAAFNFTIPTPTNGALGNGVFSSYKNAITSGGLYTPGIAGYGIDTVYFTFTSNSVNKCDTIIKTTITINGKPIVTFDIAPPVGTCLNTNGTASFSAINTKMNDNSAIQSYKWLFENGSVAGSGVAPTHNYTIDNNYDIRLIAVGVNTCVDSLTVNRTFYKTPALSLLSHAPVCENDGLVTFNAPRVTNGAIIVDSFYTSKKNAFVDPIKGIYDPSISGYGNDTIIYTVKTAGNCTASTQPFIFTIKARPRGSFTFSPSSACLDVSGLVKFDATGIIVPNSFVQTYNWQFENGLMPVSAGAKPTHNYADGTYDIRLNAVGFNGCSSITTVTQKFSRTPSLDPIVTTNVCANSSSFALNRPAVNNGVAGPLGVFTSAKNAVVDTTYYPSIANGADTLYYTFKSFSGCPAIEQKILNTFPVPKPIIYVKPDVCEGSNTVFKDLSTVYPGTISVRDWNFGDGNPDVINPVNNTVVKGFANVKTYTVRLTLMSDSGCVATDSVNVTVRAKPIAAFEVNPIVCMPNGTAYFNNKTLLPSVGAGIMNYAWTFGDSANSTLSNPNRSTQSNPSHIYSTIQPYHVRLVVTTVPYNCQDKYDDTLDVKKPFFLNPIAKFGVSKDTLCEGELISFTDSSYAPSSYIVSWTWDYGDRTTPNTTTFPTSDYVYHSYGLQKTSLVVKNGQSCSSDPYKVDVLVYPQPKIDSVSMPEIVVLSNMPVIFNPIVTDAINPQYIWSLISPLTGVSSLTHPDSLRQSFLAQESQVYELTVLGDYGCSDKRNQIVKVLGKIVIPNVFSPNGDSKNDTWDITSLGDYPGATVDIYDRYGLKMASLSGNNKWDGTRNGTPVPIGTYYYIIHPGFGLPVITGWVLVVR